MSSSPCPSPSLFYIAATSVHHFAPHWSWPWFADLISDPSPAYELVWRSVILFDPCYHLQICPFCIQRLKEHTALPTSVVPLLLLTCFSFWSSLLLLLLGILWYEIISCGSDVKNHWMSQEVFLAYLASWYPQSIKSLYLWCTVSQYWLWLVMRYLGMPAMLLNWN